MTDRQQPPRPPRVSVATLRKRGWTPLLIAKFLAEPDAFGQNPHSRNAAPTRLYDLARVAAAEQSPAYIAAAKQAAVRVAAARQAVETKRAALIPTPAPPPLTTAGWPTATPQVTERGLGLDIPGFGTVEVDAVRGYIQLPGYRAADWPDAVANKVGKYVDRAFPDAELMYGR